MIDFTTLCYLETGNLRQQKAFRVLTDHTILDCISDFDPLLVGTIPIAIDLPSSDLDIICCWTDKIAFRNVLIAAFSHHEKFRATETIIAEIPTVLCHFILDSFEIEIFGQPLPTRKQSGYRHMLIEHRLLEQKGSGFRQQVVALKAKGHKTEPAFALLLGLLGDPYAALLEYSFPESP
ncbi:DUF4269 domain-containing protein [Flavobacterium kingsejongi]|uniref:Diadenosine tetraphosphate hydrolase n=1 Tax=Flavobacterium kingsejongi TaxID=1678728 RepID=A0A2S1LSI0_9FLAO|nr:DUF4269 domain-containing protein [Flavobacterium kingsejongi]AWG26621.1 diadenosine tetraphosphate hydrolase [Flavobacterium kingsejongi]